ncbi:MAG: DedA family protein [Gemmatimonadaceae bacterium]
MIDSLLQWLQSLPAAILYVALGTAAAIENIFPPFPADTVVAFGSFLAARGKGNAVLSFTATWIGNMAGAAAMYYAGRRFGADWIRERFAGGENADRRLRVMYGKYGLGAIFLSRFLPGVRALVPPLAGSLGIPAGRALAMMALASGIWYAVITWLAFRIGSSWDALLSTIQSASMWVGIAAAALVVTGIGVFLLVRHRRRAA